MGKSRVVSPPPIPTDREGRSSVLHKIFIATHVLGRLEPVLLLPVWALLCVLAGWPWNVHRWIIAGLTALALAGDWLTLALLPRMGRSWGPVTPPLLGLALLRAALSALLALMVGSWLPMAWIVAGYVTLMAGLSALVFYATWIEPFRIQVTRQTLQLEAWKGPPLRIVHLSDLHFEGDSPRERAVLTTCATLCPDLILLTGDYLSTSSVLDSAVQAQARSWLAQLAAPLGVYAITGSVAVDVKGIVPEVFADLPVHWLQDVATSLTWNGHMFWLMGVQCTSDLERDCVALANMRGGIPERAVTILLYHTPDMMPEAAGFGVDLYLAGHTHGGQLCLPLFGALFTSSRWGKKYERGRYTEGRTTLYVSRGLGMEGWGAPRARFLAPPEIVVWELRGR